MNEYLNYYDLLGVSKNASNEDIKKAYRNQAKKWHPDLNKDPKAPEMAKKINEAKEILLDEKKRKEYDVYLNNYKNEMYDNIEKKEKKNYKEYSNKKNDYQEKTYTKWQYFMFYLKYYKVSVFRKILACIFVLIESLLCLVLHGVNYLIAYTIAFFGYYIGLGLIIFGGGLIVLMIGKLITDTNLPPYSAFDSIIMTIGSLISIIIGFCINDVLNLHANVYPVLISKLNLFLFKKSIGYKNI